MIYGFGKALSICESELFTRHKDKGYEMVTHRSETRWHRYFSSDEKDMCINKSGLISVTNKTMIYGSG